MCRVAGREQHQQLVRSQALGASLRHRGPPGKMPLGKSLVTKPKTLAVVHECLERRPFAITEDEHSTGEGILLKCFLAEPRQAIDAAAKIGRLDRHQDLHLRCDLEHHWAPQKPRAKASTSAAS